MGKGSGLKRVSLPSMVSSAYCSLVLMGNLHYLAFLHDDSLAGPDAIPHSCCLSTDLPI